MDNGNVKMGWVAMLVQGNSLNIAGISFKTNSPVRIPADLASLLKTHYTRMFKVWQHPVDQPLPQAGVPAVSNREVVTADMKPKPASSLSQGQKAKDFIVRPADVVEPVVVAQTPTAPESWPEQETPVEEETEESEETQQEDEDAVGASEFVGEGAPAPQPSAKSAKASILPKKRKTR